MGRAEIVVRVVSYISLLAGIPAVLVFGWILFVPGTAVCDGAVMSPGQTCGLPFATGDSYETMVTETTVRRSIAYAACGLALVGVVGVPAVEVYRHRQGPAPRWFTPETMLSDDPGHVAPEVLMRALTTYAARLADRERAVGPDHPDALTWRYNLANVTVLAGSAAQAIPLYEAVAAGRRRALGADHRDTIAAEAGVAYAHAMGDEPGRAMTLCEVLLPRAERVLPGRDSGLRTIRRTSEVARGRTADADADADDWPCTCCQAAHDPGSSRMVDPGRRVIRGADHLAFCRPAEACQYPGFVWSRPVRPRLKSACLPP
ncbi:tetratricopeptide repeat protein [Promicromonospora soli]|nr:tetratricopeptide repeat protein [Promicromonospora soli]